MQSLPNRGSGQIDGTVILQYSHYRYESVCIIVVDKKREMTYTNSSEMGDSIRTMFEVMIERRSYMMIRNTPFYDILSAFDALDQATSLPRRSRRRSGLAPSVQSSMPIDLYVTSDHAMVLASLPGMHPENVDVSVEKDTLTIAGSLTADRKQEDEHGDPVTWYMAEIPRGEYERRIRLPFEIEESAVEAEFSNGLLRIKLPKLEATKPRRIPVNVMGEQFAELTADTAEAEKEAVTAD